MGIAIALAIFVGLAVAEARHQQRLERERQESLKWYLAGIRFKRCLAEHGDALLNFSRQMRLETVALARFSFVVQDVAFTTGAFIKNVTA